MVHKKMRWRVRTGESDESVQSPTSTVSWLVSSSHFPSLKTTPDLRSTITLIRGLLYFSALLIFLGVYGGAYPVSIIGVLLLIPSLMATSRRPPTKQQPPVVQEFRRVVPRQPTMSMETRPAPSTVLETSPPTPAPFEHQESYTGALFPTAIFPTLSQSPISRLPADASKQGPQGTKDEVLEVGTIVAIMKLVLG